MASCCQASSHYLIQSLSKSMLPYGVTEPQLTNQSLANARIPGFVPSRESLHSRHNERDGVSNHQRLDRSFRHRSKKKIKLCVTGLCEGNPPVTGGFSSQRVSNAENVSIWWRHHGAPAMHHHEVMPTGDFPHHWSLCREPIWNPLVIGGCPEQSPQMQTFNGSFVFLS